MSTQGSAPNRKLTWLGWAVCTAVGWLPGLVNAGILNLQSLQDVLRLLPRFALEGVLIGLLIGAGQALLARREGHINSRAWFATTLAGYALAMPVGVALITAIMWVSWRARGIPLLEAGSGYFFTPIPVYPIFGGFLVGMAQWLVLGHAVPHRGFKEGTLWVLGTWAGIGLGVYTGLSLRNLLLNEGASWVVASIGERLVAGLLQGFVTGGLLLLLLGRVTTSSPTTDSVQPAGR